MKYLPLLLSVVLTGCSPYSVRIFDSAPIPLSETFKNSVVSPVESPHQKVEPWWIAFNQPELTALINEAFENNPGLEQAWAALKQAKELAIISGSERWPQTSINGSAARTRRKNVEIVGVSSATNPSAQYYKQFTAQGLLSFELDIWNRIGSQVASADLSTEARRALVEQTALMLSTQVAELWFRTVEQKALLQLLAEQIDVGEKLLELTELRFSLGRGSALDVYQQRQQLAAIKTDLPRVKQQLEESAANLCTLVGRAPFSGKRIVAGTDIPRLPQLPTNVSPKDLLVLRPDLRASQRLLQAAEYDVAAAVAERFPKLSLSLNYTFQATQASDLFDREQGSILSNILLPLIDGGRRRANVRLKKAVVEQQIGKFKENYLNALRDVELALSAEKNQLELLENLEQHINYSQATLREAKSRYINGLSDYLQVLLSLQALQALERREISERTNLILSRTRLYKSIGGIWLSDLKQNQAQIQPEEN